MGQRIDIGELYRKKLYLNRTSDCDDRKPPSGHVRLSVSDASQVAEAIGLSTVRTQADRILRTASKDARKILQNARQKAENLHEAGRKRGEAERQQVIDEARDRGYKEGIEKAESQINSRLETLDSLLKSIESEREALRNSFLSDGADLILLLTRKVTGTVLQNRSRVLKENIQSIIEEKYKDCTDLTIRLSSSDFEGVSSLLSSDKVLSRLSIKFDCDSALSDGECRIISKNGGTAFSFKKRLKVFEDELKRLFSVTDRSSL